ncbi:MAG: nascent polypeptide-associated complex protein [Candidatus Bathyarchaeota archaeon]|nr:MAG: nascent polypeptide-associated complex protein [Candidatus Bathyarchaeota archaeon]
MRRINPRQARRLMEKMGVKIDEVPETKQVIIKTVNKEIVIDEPEVTITNMQGQKIFQIAGGIISERDIGRKEIVISDEDAQLVAQQSKVSITEARKALLETKGDLAQAILLLTQRS